MRQRLLYTLAFLFAMMQTFAQRTIKYEYDTMNRLTKVTYADGSTVSYTYDQLGNRLSKSVFVKLAGDVTGSGDVDVQDATIVVNYILGTENDDDYDYSLADMNNDGEIDVFDVTAIINVILSHTNSASSRSRMRQADNLEPILLTADGNGLMIGVEQTSRFTSFQFDVEVPQGAELLGVEWNGKTSHLLQFAKNGENRYTVVALSMESKPLPALNDRLLRLRLSEIVSGEVSISDVLFVTPQGEAARFNGGRLDMTTGIQNITHTQDDQVFDLLGRQLNTRREQLGKGIYLIGNKKVVIK